MVKKYAGRYSKYLRPINYYEEKGSAELKIALLIAALNTPVQTIIKSKFSHL